jgi:DNA-binding response OmpR family regulator
MSKRILLAETEQSVREMIRDCINNLKHLVVVANSGSDALDKIEQQLFDLYIISLKLPGVDGLGLLSKIREIQPFAVIILITDYANVDVAAEALNQGAFHYLTKPIDADEIANAINSGLKHSEEKDEVGSISPASLEFSRELIDLLLLKGFTPEQQSDFQQLGSVVTYNANDRVDRNENPGTMIWVESGRLSVLYNSNQIDTLRPGDIWGEETFIGTNSVFTELIAQTESQVRHFSRKRLMEFFTYSDESLIKRFMINLIQCIYFKWRKAITKIGSNVNYGSFNIPNN